MSSRIRDLGKRLNRLKSETTPSTSDEYVRLIVAARDIPTAEQDEVVAAIKAVNQTTPGLTDKTLISALRVFLPGYLVSLPPDRRIALVGAITQLQGAGVNLLNYVPYMTTEERDELYQMIVDVERLQNLGRDLSGEEKARMQQHDQRLQELLSTAAKRISEPKKAEEHA